MNLFSNFTNSLKTGIGQQMSPTALKAPQKKPVVTSNPSAVAPVPTPIAPAVKSPTGQAYVQQFVAKPQAQTAQPNIPTVATTPTAQQYTGYTASKEVPTVTTTPVPQTPTNPTYEKSPQNSGAFNENATSRDSYISAYKNYLNTQADNTATNEAKKYLNKLVLDDQMAREKARYTGETSGFAGGEAERVRHNNSFAINAASDNLNALTLDKTNQLDVAKSGLDFAKGLATMDSDAAKTTYQKEQDKQTQKNKEIEQELANKKFEEDVRQFGIETALKNRQIRVDEQKAGVGTTPNGSPMGVNGEIDKNLTVQPAYKTLTAKQKTQADSLNNLVRTLSEYRKALDDTTGGSGINLFGKDSGLLQTKLNSIIFAAAQAEGTGALQQADREVIEQIVPNPTNLGGAFNAAVKGGKEGSLAKIDDQISKYKGNLGGFGLNSTYTAPAEVPIEGVTSSGLKYKVTQ